MHAGGEYTVKWVLLRRARAHGRTKSETEKLRGAAIGLYTTSCVEQVAEREIERESEKKVKRSESRKRGKKGNTKC